MRHHVRRQRFLSPLLSRVAALVGALVVSAAAAQPAKMPAAPPGTAVATFAGGCFWCMEPPFDKLEGVLATTSGYMGGNKSNPTYEEVCTGRTGHNEAVLVVYDPRKVSYEALLKTFWESHDPTQGMRQGNDVGTQYRSGIYVTGEAQRQAAEASKAAYQRVLSANGYGTITTEILDAGPFYFAEEYHQQYLAKNPYGYCGLGGTGLSCPVGVGLKAEA